MKTEYPTYGFKCLVCWKSILAGLVLALVTFIGIMALGVAFGGIAISDSGTTAKKVLSYTAGFVVIATLLGAFVGSYYSARVSKIRVDMQGCMQGLVVGSLLILLVLCQSMSAIGTFGQATAQVFGSTVATGAVAAGHNAMTSELVEDQLSDLKLKSNPEIVVKGVVSRLVRQDVESAKNYLAYQAGLTPGEADQKIATAKAKVDEALSKAREAASDTMKATGWTLFVLIVLGLIASVLGGLVGAKCNECRTVDVHDEEYKKGV